ncbi:hypothetical protein E2C01_095923 [Portunus trituberculatus]|uniref:Uncharacterized protein n=1 Tax=Portunus trituberculatus TaxID=210409 RepID=A0A5B7K0B8_PORTR|nr:hypothetical protein [Portunus trituberculatus]
MLKLCQGGGAETPELRTPAIRVDSSQLAVQHRGTPHASTPAQRHWHRREVPLQQLTASSAPTHKHILILLT